MKQKHFSFVVFLNICFWIYFCRFLYKVQLMNISNKVEHVAVKNIKSEDNVRTVLVLGYMHGGSSLTGELLDQTNGTIYYFEPLRPFSRPQRELKSDNTTTHLKHAYEGKIQVLKSWLSCSFNETFAQNSYISLRTWCRNCKKYLKCIGNNCGSWQKIHMCLPLLKDICKKAHVRIAKVIRLEMKLVSELLNSDPNLKVVHLLRDPRAILSTRLNLGEFPKYDNKIESTNLCQNMHRNIRDYLKLKENPQFRNRMTTVFFEDLGEYPIDISKEIFRFLEIPFTTRVQKWIETNMMGTTERNTHPFSVKYHNSHLHMNAWRSKLSYDLIKDIDESCQSLYEISRYNKVNSDNQLRNIELKLSKQNSL